jgi:hypothetical protein
MAENNTTSEVKENLIENDPNGKTKKLVLEKLENGQTFKDACVLAGISEPTGHRWKSLGGEDAERLSELAGKGGLTDKEKLELRKLEDTRTLCESFKSQCEVAELRYKEKLIKCVNIGSLKDAKVALEVLKMRWPEDWRPKNADEAARIGSQTNVQINVGMDSLKDDERNKVLTIIRGGLEKLRGGNSE